MEKLSLRWRPYQEPPGDKHLDVLDGFRAICVLLVGWYHIWQQGWLSPSFEIQGQRISLDFLLRSGYLWVDGLLLLSGFLLYLPYTQSGKAPAILSFYRRRLARILPSYLLCILPLFVLALIALLLLLPLCRWPLLTMLTLYGALDLFFAAKSALEAPRGKLLTFICLPFLFPVVHIVYGAGTLCGLLAGKAQPHA